MTTAAPAAARVLVVDDEPSLRQMMQVLLERAGHQVTLAAGAHLACEVLRGAPLPFDLIVSDLVMPDGSGLDVLDAARGRSDETQVVIVTAHASVETAVEAMRRGAYGYLEKPISVAAMRALIEKALEKRILLRDNAQLRVLARERMPAGMPVVGKSVALQAALELARRAAPSRASVLITGESGTGKELIARAVHRLSDRRDQPFIMLNCAAIPAELIESELFGHERGAFTGAHSRKKGMFELADGGTLFLDEIGDMSLSAQAKVLRALQSGEISRVGGERAIAVDVRVIAATNKDLAAEVAHGHFRDDLYFRLSVVPLRSPALRERTSDIPLLARAFFADFCGEYGGRTKSVDPRVFELLAERAWPGNVRELRNVVERMVILSGPEIGVDDVPPAGFSRIPTYAPPAVALASEEILHPLALDTTQGRALRIALPDDELLPLRDFRDRAEREYILMTLQTCDWNISRAATLLGVERTNLHKKLRSLGIQRAD